MASSISLDSFKHKKHHSSANLSDQTEEIKAKDKMIHTYQKQLSVANETILQITKQINTNLQQLYHLHENLIPTKFPSIDKCEFSYKFISSASGMGKDFYQVIPLHRMHFGLVMSSCISHILSSLLFSSRLRLMARVDYKKLQPAEVLKNLIQDIHDQHEVTRLKSQIDLFYAVINQKKYQISYCSIGKVQSFLYSFTTKELYELKPCADQFSLESSVQLSNKKIDLNSRDHLIVCSPGIIEATNRKGEMFGVERLKEVIQKTTKTGAHLMRNRLIHKVQSFTQKKKLSRDQSVMVMEIRDKILKLA